VTIKTGLAAIKRRGESGAVAVEFALLAPILAGLLAGIVAFWLVLNQYVMLWNGAGAGAMQFAISGGASGTPASSAWTALTGAAPALTVGNSCTSGLCMTLTVNGTNCLTNPNSLTAAQAADMTCANALQSNAGNPAYASATYPCSLALLQYNFWPNCQLSAQVTELVQ
jgi:Flp pilus assembly protein TadG